MMVLNFKCDEKQSETKRVHLRNDMARKTTTTTTKQQMEKHFEFKHIHNTNTHDGTSKANPKKKKIGIDCNRSS